MLRRGQRAWVGEGGKRGVDYGSADGSRREGAFNSVEFEVSIEGSTAVGLLPGTLPVGVRRL